MHSIRTRMVVSLLALIGLAFLCIMIAFNISVERYIDVTAKEELEAARSAVFRESGQVADWDVQARLEENRMAQRMGSKRNPIGAEVEAFQWNGTTAFTVNWEAQETAQEIGEGLVENAEQEVQTVTTPTGTFLVSILHHATLSGEQLVLYVDITPMQTFATNLNTLLIVILLAVGAAAVAVALALASSVAKPIEKIAAFAKQIGENDFTPVDWNFKDREIADLLSEMNHSAHKLAAYDSEQKTFFQNVSHELKTPLMSIRCNAEGIACRVMEPEGSAHTIMQETDRLGSMIDDILFVSKMDTITESEVLEPRDLRELISNSAERQKAAAENRNVHFMYDFSEEPIIHEVSEKSMQRALSNLISNAIRYAKSEVVLTCVEQNGHAIVSIWNDGPRISAEDLPHVFERFYKGVDGQSGIGLSIVKSVAEKLGGTVSASSDDTGTSFTITL